MSKLPTFLEMSKLRLTIIRNSWKILNLWKD